MRIKRHVVWDAKAMAWHEPGCGRWWYFMRHGINEWYWLPWPREWVVDFHG